MSAVLRQRPGSSAVEYDPFAAGELSRVAPTTEPQREVWLADRLGEEASLAFNESVRMRLRGALDVEALKRSLQSLFDRHDALRSNFGPDGETLCVARQRPLATAWFDLSGQADAERETALAEHMRLAVETRFGLEHDPLFRAELLRLDTNDHVLLMTAHHIVCDGWSWWVLIRELGCLYSTEVLGDADAVPEPLQVAESFADYALDQAKATNAHGQDQAYWLSEFETPAPVLDLPCDRPRPARRGFSSARVDHVLEADLVAALRSTGARRGASLFATLLAGFSALLSRLCDQSEVVIGIPAAGQSVDGHDGLVGHCVNLLPLRFTLDDTRPMSVALDHAQEKLLDAIEHQHYTFGSLLKQLQVARDPARLPLVSVMFNIDQALHHESTAFPGLDLEFSSNPRSYENFELFVNAVQEHGALRLECQYATGLFDEATIRRWLGSYEALLRSAIATPQAALGELPLIDKASQRELVALQPQATHFDAGLLMHRHFEAQCDRTPDRVAVRCGATSLSYAELDERANRIACVLKEQGVHAGHLVGLAMDRGTDMLAALLGILKSGAAYVPLDPHFPVERLAYMVGDAGLAALLTESHHADAFDLRGRPVVVVDAIDEQLAAQSGDRPALESTPDAGDAAYVIYTSGSTGRPKGVAVQHRAVANFLAAMVQTPGLSASDRLVAVTTLSFDIAVLELFLPLSVGAEVIIADRDTVMDGNALDALLRDSDATAMQATPSTWRLMLDAGWEGIEGFKALCGGESLPPGLAGGLLDRCGELWNLYGPTETTVWSSCARIGRIDGEDALDVHIGRPIANTRIWIVDKYGQLCPSGVPGEICIGGEGVSLGYLHQPELTSQRFVPEPACASVDGADPAIVANGMYRTGDRGRWRMDGNLEHLGRLDHQVKLRGYRIELGEIESNALGHAGTAQALALIREDRAGDARLVLYVVPAAGRTVDEQDLLVQLHRTLPDYMIPQHVVALESLPLLPNGKLDRNALPVPGRDAGDASTRIEPRNRMEREIAQAMSQVLGIDAVGIHDDFFVLGGHSLLAARLTARLNRDMGMSLSLRALFDCPTVARLAGLASDQDDAPSASHPILPRKDQTCAPLSLAQERLCLLRQFNPDQLTYNTPSAHRLSGVLDVEVLDRAVRDLAQRQTVLRTGIENHEGVLVQVVHDDIDTGLLQVQDLSALPEEQREQELAKRLRALVEVPFADLAKAPLFCARLFRLAHDEHVLFFMPHQLVWDGWSFDLMYAELAEMYAARIQGRAPVLPELPVTYGDYSAWHRDWVQGPDYARQLDFWRRRLGQAGSSGEGPRAMPTDKPRRHGMSGRGHSHGVAVSTALTEALRTVSRELGTTLFVTLLTAYFALMGRVTGQRDMVVASPVHGRNSAEVESVMGYFTNLLPLRVRLDPGLPFAQAVALVKETVLESFAHPDIRLEDLTRELSLRGNGGGAVLYQSLFSFQDARERVMQWGNLRHRRVEVFQPGATEDLGLWFLEDDNGLTGGLVYNAEILHDRTALLLRGRYLQILESVAADPAQTLASLTRFDDGSPARIGSQSADADPAAASGGAALYATDTTPMAATSAQDNDTSYLCKLWSEMLGIDVGADDDFFDLGGNSMLAVQMFHRASQALNTDLPLATLLSAPTARTLATSFRVARQSRDSTAGTQATVRSDPWTPLVLMRPGTDQPPLFLVHAVGGNVLNYRPLAEAMPAGVPVYGLQAVGIDGVSQPLTRIEDMAALYIEQMRTLQPQGPYHLAGSSMGGMIAYEIARQLSAQGQHVAFLGLIDTSATYGETLRKIASGQMGSRASRVTRRLLTAPWRESMAVLRQRFDAGAFGLRVAITRMLGMELPHTVRYVQLESTHREAYRDYLIRPYQGSIVLFRAQQQYGPCRDDASLGWSGLVSGVRTYPIPGDHEVVVEAPELARSLREALERAYRCDSGQAEPILSEHTSSEQGLPQDSEEVPPGSP